MRCSVMANGPMAGVCHTVLTDPVVEPQRSPPPRICVMRTKDQRQETLIFARFPDKRCNPDELALLYRGDR